MKAQLAHSIWYTEHRDPVGAAASIALRFAEMEMSVERIEADYLIETAHNPAKAVEVMAGEQSSGTFVPVPGETPELKARSAARVERLEVVGEAEHASLPGSSVPTARRAPRHRPRDPFVAA